MRVALCPPAHCAVLLSGGVDVLYCALSGPKAPESEAGSTVSEPLDDVNDDQIDLSKGFVDAFTAVADDGERRTAWDEDEPEKPSASKGNTGGGSGRRRQGQTMRGFSASEAKTLADGVPAIMRSTRARLPSAKKRDDILKALVKSQVLVVTGETGCGKTTQVPQFIMEQTGGECFIICTQPRRLSAIGVSTRVAQERGENIDGTTSTVGYSVRGESRRTSRTRLLFCTTGVLLRRMQQQDPLLDGSCEAGERGQRPATKITHVIVDEVHERSLDSDHLLTLLKEVLAKRRDLKVILMSATINAERFAGYFGGCGIEHIQGFTHPIKQNWLEDVVELTGHRVKGAYASGKDAGMLDEDDFNRMGGPLESPGGGYSKSTIESLRAAMGAEDKIDTLLVARLVLRLADQLLTDHTFSGGQGRGGQGLLGSILVFLPGLFQIRQIHDILSTGRGRFRGNDLEPAEADAARGVLFPLMLHSTVPPRDQQKVFQRPPKGLVKVVLSTNIAETSITIDDVVCVIDTLRVNETGFDAVNGIACLEEKFCSQAAHRQRAGRGGRVRAGECWSLVTKKRHDNLPKFELPEIFRVPLDQLYLRIESSLAALPSSTSGKGKNNGKGKLASATTARNILQQFMDPPGEEAVSAAIESLRQVGALTAGIAGAGDRPTMTALGHHLAYVPIDLRLAKVLLYGAIFRCVDPAATVAACLGAGRSPLLSPPDKRAESAEAHERFVVQHSDHLTLLRVYDEWASMPSAGTRRRFCQQNFLSDNSLQDIAKLRKQLLAALQEMGFLPPASQSKWNQHAKYTKLVSAVVCAGLFPRVVKVKKPETTYQQTMAGAFEKKGDTGTLKYYTEEDRVFIHPQSVYAKEAEHTNLYLVYFEKSLTKRDASSKVRLRCALPAMISTRLGA